MPPRSHNELTYLLLSDFDPIFVITYELIMWFLLCKFTQGLIATDEIIPHPNKSLYLYRSMPLDGRESSLLSHGKEFNDINAYSPILN
jgi:hypothetical protein